MSAPCLDPALHGVLRASLLLLFAASSAHKLRGPRLFAAQLAEYRLLPAVASLPATLALAGAELAVAVALATPAAARAGAGAGLLLLALYSGAVAINLLRGRHAIDCGCGFAPRPLGAGLLARNALLAAAALAATLPTLPRALGWIDVPAIAGGTLAAALVFAAADGIAARLASLA